MPNPQRTAFADIAQSEEPSEPGFYWIPNDPADLSAGAISGTFDPENPPAWLAERFAKALGPNHEESAAKKTGAEGRSDREGDAPWDEEESERRFDSTLNDVLDQATEALERAGMGPPESAPHRPAEVRGPAVALYEVTWVRAAGMRIRELGLLGELGGSVRVRHRRAVDYFEKGDVIMLGWDEDSIAFVPPSRSSWCGCRD